MSDPHRMTPVTVPPDRFLTNTVFLKSNVNLYLGQECENSAAREWNKVR